MLASNLIFIYTENIFYYIEMAYILLIKKKKRWPIYSIEAIGIAIDLIKSC